MAHKGGRNYASDCFREGEDRRSVDSPGQLEVERDVGIASAEARADSPNSTMYPHSVSDSNYTYGVPSQYTRFYWKCMDLKSELARFGFALRTVGSSGPGIIATNMMIDKLRVLRDAFGMNAHLICPKDPHLCAFGDVGSPPTAEMFAIVFKDFAESLDLLASALRDFNEIYYDDALMLLLFTLHKRFINEAKSLSRDGDKLNRLQFQKSLDMWVEKAVESLIKAISDFGEKGVPTIFTSQHYQTARYLHMTTIATFLSGVTVSMIQLSSNQGNNAIDVATNALFFTSLVFSTCSAVTSLLVMSWRSSKVRDPRASLPQWAYTWLNSGPLYTVLLAAALFSVALCLYVLSTQNIVTTGMTLMCSGLCAVMVIVFCGWYALERWRYRRDASIRGQIVNNESVTVVMIDLAMRFLAKLKRAHTKTKGEPGDLSTAERGEWKTPKATVHHQFDLEQAIRGKSVSSIMNETFLINNAVAYEEGPFRAHVAYPVYDVQVPRASTQQPTLEPASGDVTVDAYVKEQTYHPKTASHLNSLARGDTSLPVKTSWDYNSYVQGIVQPGGQGLYIGEWHDPAWRLPCPGDAAEPKLHTTVGPDYEQHSDCDAHHLAQDATMTSRAA